MRAGAGQWPHAERCVTLHQPTLIVAALAMMAMSSALMTLFGRTQRVYRGFWWWTAAQWMATAGLALQLLRGPYPELLPASNLLLLQWPVVTLIGVRRFYPRQELPVPPSVDVMLLAFAFLLWAATWAAGGDREARIVAFGFGACILFLYSAAITLLLHVRHRSPALQALVALHCVAAAVQALRAANAGLPDVHWLASEDLTLIVGLTTAMMAIAMVYLSPLLTHERTTLKLAESQRRLRQLAYTDALTEVPNRRHFYQLATKALALGGPATAVVVTFDIDHFKHINDAHGHAEGDEALREVARCTRDTLRAHDVAGRIGGDEFAMLLPQTRIDDALAVADRLSARLDRQREASGGVALSLSFGIVLARDGENIADALRRADQALYEAKRQGRRRAVVADGSAASPSFGESRAMGLSAH